MKTRIKHINLCKWFPSDDPIANAVARLCILKEDLSIEMEGVVADKIENLDKTSINTRKLYFVRNSVRTLHEIVKAIDDLQKDKGKYKEFEQATSKLGDKLRNNFEDFFKMIADRKKEIIKLRNNLWGGHVGEPAMENTLQQLNIDRKGLLEYKERERSKGISIECRYRFASDLILAHSLDKMHPNDQEQEIRRLIGEIAQFTGAAIPMIDNIFKLYAKVRHLR